MSLAERAPVVSIHPTAVVEDGAVLGEGTVVGAYSIIGPQVRAGRNNRIGPHVVLDGHTTLGDENVVYPFACLGAPPQDLKWAGEDTTLCLGNRNIVREYVTIQPGTAGGGAETTVGDDNLFMACSHIAHDCHVGSHVHLTNSTALAGHIRVDDYAILSGLCGVHQFVHIGRHAYVAGGAMVTQDVPPFCLAQGDRARLVGVNRVGLARHGIAEADIGALHAAFRMLFRGGGLLAERLAATGAAWPDHPLVGELIAFIRGSARGVVAARGVA